MRNWEFKFDEIFAKEKVPTPWNTFKVDENYYKVDRKYLDTLLPRSERIGTAFLPSYTPSDREILRTVMKFANINSKHIAGKTTAIQFTEQEGVNNASYTGTTVNISLSPFYDHRVPLVTRFNIVAGLIYHELFHCRYTTPGAAEMLVSKGHLKSGMNKFGRKTGVADFDKLEEILPTPLFGHIVNILEDLRIETIGLKEFPGYVFFFDDLRTYCLWRNNNKFAEEEEAEKKKKKTKTTVVAESDPLEGDAILLRYLYYKILAPEMMQAFLDSIIIEEPIKKKCDKIDSIVEVAAKTFQEVHAQSEEIYKLFTKEFQENFQPQPMFGMVSLPEEMLEALAELIETLQQELAESGHSDVKVEVKKLPRTKGLVKPYNQVDIIDAEPGVYEADVYNEATRIARALQINLAFLDSRFNRTIENYELRYGEIDSDALYSLRFKNRDLFYDEEESPGYSLDVGLLVDESGSMGHGGNIRQAKIATLAMALALKNSEYINLFVYGHTADMGGKQLIMHKYLDPFKGANNLTTLFNIKSRGNNADGYAIEQMGQIMKQSRSPQKVLIVISDGQPAASCYSGGWGSTHTDEGIKHTSMVVKQLEREKVFVVQVAIDNIENSAEMFTHFIPYDGGAKLGQNLKQILNKKLVQISNLV